MQLPFDRAEVREAFGTTAFRHGAEYAAIGAVRHLDIDEGGRLLRARVHGTASRPYSVEVTVAEGRGRRVVSYCSCPVRIQCKHGAAVMLAALGRGGGRDLPPAAKPVPKPPPEPVDPLAGPVGAWLDRLAAVLESPPAKSATGQEQLIFVLSQHVVGMRREPRLEPRAVRALKAGGWGADRPYPVQNLAQRAARFVTAEDALIGRLLDTPKNRFSPGALPEEPETVDLLFERVLATGRCHWESKDGPRLSLGPGRPGRLAWTLTSQGTQMPVVEAAADGLVALALASPWYVDPAAGIAGPLQLDCPRPALRALLEAPPIEPRQAVLVRRFLANRITGLPAPESDIVEEERRDPPRPALTLVSQRTWMAPAYYGYGATPSALDLALLHFDYDGITVGPNEQRETIRRVEGNRVITYRRQSKAERAAERRLQALGLREIDHLHLGRLGLPEARKSYMIPSGIDADWWEFVHREVPQLLAEGWTVTFDPSFRHKVVEAAGEWEAMLGEAGVWFSLELGVEVDGERIPLLPILARAIEGMRNAGSGFDLAAFDPDSMLYVPLDDGRVVALPIERVRPMLEILVELFDRGALGTDGRLDISLSQALALAEHEAALKLRWLGGERLKAMAERLRALPHLAEADAPPGFTASLRPYQRFGLAWLQFLAESGLGGILADDMGLGKTVQTLAHILTEKVSGRLTAPVLVVCPTSLVANWRREAERHAPDLRVLTLHGSKRAQSFAAIPETDLALTTYPLLIRDADHLLPVEWHAVVLDEAQAIKNPASKAAQFAVKLKADHRLCLTGTPIENHLGELWSQISFLVPGLLAEHKRFAKVFRTPIEKQGDEARRELLASRIRPFVLRRTKAEVESQLPPKTEIVRRIELSGEQRDLYETVRLAMHERVRQEIAAKGFNRSQIIVLDALLKLRQVCCDPRLVKLSAAKKVHGSAKLHYLLDMLPELVESGRRILLFSQFTSMLDLIRPEVDRLGLGYVELRGDTEDRATPVGRFQAGEVPIFLLSLKAGGVGLNLTAADTVILYDPWWNPAVEDQAADRAHRIGQDKPVFVYKLIAEGTIEERMLELQERKRALAAGILDESGEGFASFGEADIERLFQPLG